jgi:hypothetical protein
MKQIVVCYAKGYSIRECEIDNRQAMWIPQLYLLEGNPSRQSSAGAEICRAMPRQLGDDLCTLFLYYHDPPSSPYS